MEQADSSSLSPSKAQSKLSPFSKKKLPEKELTPYLTKIKSFLKTNEQPQSTLPKEEQQLLIRIFTQSSGNASKLMKCLNNMRSDLIIMQIPQFEFIVSIFMTLLDRYNSKRSLKDKHLFILDYIVILSQTFYSEKSSTNTIMSNIIAQHPIWKENIWNSLIKRQISQEKKMQEKMGLVVNGEKERVLIVSTLVTYKFVIKAFHQNDNLPIIKQMERKYNITIPEI